MLVLMLVSFVLFFAARLVFRWPCPVGHYRNSNDPSARRDLAKSPVRGVRDR